MTTLFSSVEPSGRSMRAPSLAMMMTVPRSAVPLPKTTILVPAGPHSWLNGALDTARAGERKHRAGSPSQVAVVTVNVVVNVEVPVNDGAKPTFIATLSRAKTKRRNAEYSDELEDEVLRHDTPGRTVNDAVELGLL